MLRSLLISLLLCTACAAQEAYLVPSEPRHYDVKVSGTDPICLKFEAAVGVGAYYHAVPCPEAAEAAVPIETLTKSLSVATEILKSQQASIESLQVQILELKSDLLDHESYTYNHVFGIDERLRRLEDWYEFEAPP